VVGGLVGVGRDLPEWIVSNFLAWLLTSECLSASELLSIIEGHIKVVQTG